MLQPPEQQQVSKEKGNVEETHEEQRGLSRRISDIACPEKKEEPGREHQQSHDEKKPQRLTVKKGERQECTRESGGESLQPPGGESHAVVFEQAQKAEQEYKTGEEEKAPLEDQQDKKRQGDGSRQNSFVNAQFAPLSSVPFVQLVAGPPEPPLACLVIEQGLVQFSGVEVGPVHVGEIEFGVGKLPEQEVAYPHLSAGTDQKIGVGNVPCKE